MDFSLSTEQVRIQSDAMSSVGQHDALPSSAHVEFWPIAGKAGWLGTCVHPMHGGRGLGALDAVLSHEALGQAGLSRSALFAMGAHLFGVSKPIELFGETGARARWLSALVQGQAIGGLALSEPAGGSELSNLMTTATATADGWVITGEKTYVTNGPLADVFLVSARHPEVSAPGFSTSVFAVPRVAAGLTVDPITTALGLAGAPMARVSLSDVCVGAQHLLGRRGQGLAVILSAMQWERSCILSGFLGAAAYDLAATKRFFKDQKRGRHQAVDLAFADMHTRLETARWMLYRGAWAVENKGDPVKEPATSKAVVSRVLAELARDLQELAAGAGWCDQMGLATAVADTMGCLTASGTTTTQLRAIATRLGL